MRSPFQPCINKRHPADVQLNGVFCTPIIPSVCRLEWVMNLAVKDSKRCCRCRFLQEKTMSQEEPILKKLGSTSHCGKRLSHDYGPAGKNIDTYPFCKLHIEYAKSAGLHSTFHRLLHSSAHQNPLLDSAIYFHVLSLSVSRNFHTRCMYVLWPTWAGRYWKSVDCQ